jgi:methyl-accepting chemotaxis protein
MRTAKLETAKVLQDSKVVRNQAIKKGRRRVKQLLFGNIRQRLITAFSVFIALLVLMAATGVWRLLELNRVSANMSGTADANSRIQRLARAWLAEADTNAVRAAVLLHSDDPELMRVLAPQLVATARQIAESQKELAEFSVDRQGQALLDDVGAKRNRYLELRNTVLDKKKLGQADEAVRLLDSSMLPAAETYIGSARRVAGHYSGGAQKEAAEVAATADAGRDLLIAAGATTALLGILFARWITLSILRPLRKVISIATQVADGDLSMKLEAREISETGHLLKAIVHMTDNLRTLLAEVTTGAHAVRDTSAQIAQGNVHLSQRTEEQASTLEETASTMEELTATVAQNAENARKASQLAVGASEVAHRGGAVVDQVLGIMDGIEDSSKKIANIVGVIDGIAFQTNLLALNAAVEAARAGEQGRGFAVVAAEVRNLAQRSAAAAKEVKTLIGDSVQKVQAGATLANDAGHTMVEVVSSFQQVSDLIAEIATASQEQSSGIQQINTAITQMEQAVQHDASLVEEGTAATESMNDQAGSLLQIVSRFKLREDSGEDELLHTAAPISRSRGTGKARTPAADRLRERAASTPPRRQIGQLGLDSKF